MDYASVSTVDPLVFAFASGPVAMQRLCSAEQAQLNHLDADQVDLLAWMLSCTAQRRPRPVEVQARLQQYLRMVVSAERLAIYGYLFLGRIRLDREADYQDIFRHFANACVASEAPPLPLLPAEVAVTMLRRADKTFEYMPTDAWPILPEHPLRARGMMRWTLTGIAGPSLSFIEELGTDVTATPLDRLQMRLFNAISSGNAEVAITLMSSISLNHKGNRFMAHASLPIVWYMQAIQNGIVVGREEILEREEAAIGDTKNLFSEDCHDVLAVAHAEATEMRRILNKEARKSRLASGFSLISFNQIRAALLLGEIDEAADMLSWRSRRYFSNYLDHLFWMRIHLLDQDVDKATGHLEALMEGARYYDCLGRVEFELRISRELKLHELATMQSRVSNRDPAERPAIVPRLQPPQTSSSGSRLVGSGPVARHLNEQIATYSEHRLPVLILGETGVGKDLVARSLHESSGSAGEPFIAINCGAFNDNLLEAELFGHVKGSYTGAADNRDGLISAAGKGTLFLDEIGDTTSRFQVALLRLLEQEHYRPIGSDKEQQLHCRVIAATNLDLHEAVKDGRFREDLLYRLQRLCVLVPPLRERRSDIPELALYFLNQGRESAKRQLQLDDALIEFLASEPWPGNIRQLRNQMERLHVHYPLHSTFTLSDYLKLPHDGSNTVARHAQTVEPVFNEGEWARHASAVQAGPSVSASDWDQAGHAPSAAVARVAPNVAGGNPQMRRVEGLRQLFQVHQQLTRKVVIAEMGISASTATKYLQQLVDEEYIEKIMPNAAPISHYFQLRR